MNREEFARRHRERYAKVLFRQMTLEDALAEAREDWRAVEIDKPPMAAPAPVRTIVRYVKIPRQIFDQMNAIDEDIAKAYRLSYWLLSSRPRPKWRQRPIWRFRARRWLRRP